MRFGPFDNPVEAYTLKEYLENEGYKVTTSEAQNVFRGFEYHVLVLDEVDEKEINEVVQKFLKEFDPDKTSSQMDSRDLPEELREIDEDESTSLEEDVPKRRSFVREFVIFSLVFTALGSLAQNFKSSLYSSFKGFKQIDINSITDPVLLKLFESKDSYIFISKYFEYYAVDILLFSLVSGLFFVGLKINPFSLFKGSKLSVERALGTVLGLLALEVGYYSILYFLHSESIYQEFKTIDYAVNAIYGFGLNLGVNILNSFLFCLVFFGCVYKICSERYIWYKSIVIASITPVLYQLKFYIYQSMGESIIDFVFYLLLMAVLIFSKSFWFFVLTYLIVSEAAKLIVY